MLNRLFKLIPIVAVTAVFCLFSNNVNAQSFQTGYFLDNYVYGYRLNPALGVGNDDTKTVVGFVLNDITLGTSTNVGVENFLFNKGGQTVPFTDDLVTKQEFLSGLPAQVNAFASLDLSLLTLGFKTRHGFLTFDTRIRSRNMVTAPKELFTLIKDIQNDGENMANANSMTVPWTNVKAREYFEVGVGYSTRITPDIKVGATVKLLLGAANASFSNSDITIRPNDEGFVVSGSANASITASMVEYDPQKILRETKKYGLQGFGAAIDLGVVWDTPVEGLSASAAVTDLGGIFWKNSIVATANHNETAVSLVDDPPAEEVIASLVDFQTNTKSSFEGVGATFDLGVKYKMPFYERLTVGLHGSFGLGAIPYRDVRFGVTVTPIDQISLALTAASTSNGGAFGAAANFHLGGLNIFGGVDGFITGFGPDHYPVKPVNTVVKLGFTIDVFER
ncbi:MAG: hypothetical protein IJS02_03370 [Bacteroidales bacterium]|nr:hypothetical protein [Bacteroidales bacterium]